MLFPLQLYSSVPDSLEANKKMALHHVTVESEGVQVFDDVAAEQPADDSVGRPIVHQAGIKHATGEAIYVDDIPHSEGTKYSPLIGRVVRCALH